MLVMLGTMAIALAAVTPSPAPAASAAQSVSAATPVTATAATPRRRRHADHTAVATPAGATYDAAAIDEQMRLRVLSPVLSGDGGG
ncbi:MAG: hypothetical protein QOD51_2574 [Candidatus Eremiobacteraeota bacterium]|jgi:hypothetical protein|nr:hypothetical protein [Candidatus Eremiobacteraeota bacterium]